MSLNEILRIRQFNAERLEKVEAGVLIFGQLQETDKTCPACGEEAEKPHQYYQRRVRHLPFAEQPTYLVFERKDWICACGKVFLERLEFQELHSKYTKQYGDYIFRECQRSSTSSVSEKEQLEWHVIAGIFKKGSQNQRKSTRRGGGRRIYRASPG